MYLSQKNVWVILSTSECYTTYIFFLRLTVAGIIPTVASIFRSYLRHRATWKRNTWNIIKSPLPHIHNVDTNRLPKAAWVVSNLDLRGWLGPSSNVDQRCRSHPLEELPPAVDPTREMWGFFVWIKKTSLRITGNPAILWGLDVYSRGLGSHGISKPPVLRSHDS